MAFPIVARRVVYRMGYRVLQVFWIVRGPQLNGAKCVITDRDTVLLVRHTYGHRWWDLPGGEMHTGEDPAHAARREMREELGLDIAHWSPIGDLAATLHRRRDTLHCFQAELDTPAITLDLGEIAAAWWFKRAELPHDLAPWVVAILARTTVQPSA